MADGTTGASSGAGEPPSPWLPPEKRPAAGRRPPKCKLHPSNDSVGFCTACGSPMCPACRTNAMGRAICTTCFESQVEARKRHEEEKEQLKQRMRRAYLRTRWYFRGPLGYVSRFFLWVRDTGFQPGMRMAAWAINGFFILFLSAVGFITGDFTLGLDPAWREPWQLYLRPWVPLAAAVVYLWPAWGLFGRDLGKWAMGLKLEGPRGRRLGLWRALWRVIGMAGMVAWMGAGLLVLTWTQWIVGLAEGRLEGKVTLFIWAAALSMSGLSWLTVFLMFLGRQKRHLGDFIGQSMVVTVRLPVEEEPEEVPGDVEEEPATPAPTAT